MKTKTPILSRCLAMLLALVLSFANVPGLVLTAFAAEAASVGAGEVVAENYTTLTDEEKALLKSGYLAGDYTIEYSVPEDSDDLVEVNADEKKITAKPFSDWTAVKAEIVVDEAVEETVSLVDGEANYSYSGNAFSVKVTYELVRKVDNQEMMLGAIAPLKQGVANIEKGLSADTNLGVVVMAKDVLTDFADGFNILVGGSFNYYVKFNEPATKAVYEFNSQIEANDGRLDLQVMNEECSSKTKFLVENGADYKACLAETYKLLNDIKEDPFMKDTFVEQFIQANDPTSYATFKAFKDIISTLVAALEPAANAEWVTEDLVKDGANYAVIDVLVANLGELTEVEASSNLKIAEATVLATMNTKNVAVKVVLNVVEDAIGSDAIVEYAHKDGSVIVNADATADDVAAKVLASGIEAAAIAEWGTAYAAEHFNKEVTAEAEAYTITYSPKNYTVTLGYADNMTVPYGYKYVLPVHDDVTKAYDYKVNGVKTAQNEVVVITGDTEITRTLGKSYTNDDLYAIIAKNYGNDVVKAILNSGALSGNETISYRKPDPADAGSLLELKDGKLTAAEAYPSSYEGLDWAPYTYGVEGNETEFDGNVVDWPADKKEVKAQYKLELTNFTVDEVKAILDLAKEIKEDAEAQKSAMESLAGIDELKDLNKTMFGAMGGAINTTDFTPDDGTDTDAENLEIRAYFKEVIDEIVNNHFSGTELLISKYVSGYEVNGLAYYYQNAEAIRAEVNKLASYLGKMTDKEEALVIMLNAVGYGQYVDKISGVEEKLNTYLDKLSAPNAAIDTESVNLANLVNAVNMSGEATYTTPGHPYVVSAELTALDESQVNVQVIIEVPGNEATVTGASVDKETVIDQAYINELKGKVDAKVAELLSGKQAYYELSVEGGKTVESLLNEKLTGQINLYYTYSLKEYTVKIDGEADQTVTINKLYIDLPKHPKAAEGFEYRYTVDGVETAASTYTFTLDQIDDLFVDDVYTITRAEYNTKQEEFEENFGDWFVKDAEGNVVALKAKVDANKDGVMDFAMKLLEGGYEYIGLNGEPFVYMNDGALEICMQTFVNALLNDETFTSDMLIALGTNGKGAILNTTIQLGNEVEGKVVIAEDKPFTLYLNSVPSQMGTVSKGLDAIKDYLTFGAKDGVLEVTADLPEKVYEVYLAAMLATGNVDKTDITALNSAIAYQFLWDYIDIIVNSGATTQTYTNTLAKLGIDKDLTGYEKYYNLVQKALSDPDMIIAGSEGDDFAITINAPTKTAVDKLISVLGLGNNEQINLYVGYVKEYKGEGSPLTVKAIAKLADAGTAFEAALVDIRQPANKTIDHLKKFDFTKDLDARADEIAGEAAIILLDDIGTTDPDGKVSLVFNDTTIIDLNGHTINGTITAANNCKVLIFDSSLNTYNCGGVTGGISGNVTIVGGVYGSDVSAFLPDGFVLDGNTVRNELYTNEEDEDGNVIFNIDADVINADIDSYTKAAAAIAADMAVDLVLNYFTCASLDIVNTEDDETYSIYNISVEDIIGLYAGTNRKEALINTALGFVSLDDINGFINYVIDELMAFADVEAAIRGNAPILTLDAKVSPWYVRVARNANEDYIELGIVPNPDVVEEFSIGLRMAGTEAQKEFAADIIGVLSDIVVADRTDADITINTPSYKDKTLSVSGSAEATVVIDVTEDQNNENDDYIDFANEDYLNVLAVVIANGVPAKRDALVAAVAPVGEMDYDAMKEAIDEVTAKELFDALKALSRNEDFADMCARIGVTEDLGDAAKLEEIYHLVACAAGKGLETLDITGPDSKLGNLYEGGYYQLSGTRSANKSVSAKGFTINVGAEDVKVDIKVKLYPEVEECKHSETETIKGYPATCTATGLTDGVKCSVCGEILVEQEEIPMIDHSRETVPGKAPTCTEPGLTDGVKCSVCGEILVEQEEIPMIDHSRETVPGKAPTCTEPGLTDGVKCSVCGEILVEQEEIPAGCYDADGDHKCDRCGNYLPNAPHVWSETKYEWVKTSDGKYYCVATRTCDCGYEQSVSVEAAIVERDEGTCVEEGYIKYYADFDDLLDWVVDQDKTIYTGLGDHDYGAWHTVVRPTTSRRGRQERVCKICGHVDTRYLAKLDEEEKKEETEKNPETGASINVGSAISAIAVVAGTAYVLSNKKH